MDDYLNELFGNNEPKSEEPSAPEEALNETPAVPEEPETPAAPEVPTAPAEPIEPEVPTAPAEPIEPEVPAAPAEPESSAQPETQTPPYFGAYQTVPPRQQGAYSEPAYPQYQQPNMYYQPPYQAQSGTYYTPPVNGGGYTPSTELPPIPEEKEESAASPLSGAEAAVEGAPKKKRKTALMVCLIGILCIAVAIIGVYSAASGKDSGGNSSSIFNFSGEESGDDTEQEDNSDAEVSVKSSDEAAKKDNSGNLTAAGVAEKAKSSCVGITVYTEQSAYNYFYNYGQQNGSSDGNVASGEGSGVIMSEANGKTYILTCAHVISDGSSFKVTLDDDTEYDAEMVGYDSQTDIGVLSIKATGLSIAEFGDSKDIEVGEACVAIGCPGGLTFKNSVTAGIVSALDVPVSSSIGYNNECIQVDAAINPGNSGGALFNMQGQVIGINSSKIASTEYEGMGFAVPSNTAVNTANSLIKNGYVEGRAKIGIQYNTLSAFTSANSILSALNEKGYENANGTMVIQTIDEESDLNGKVQQYDMIVAVNGTTMTSIDVLTSVLSKSKPGDTITLTIARINNNRIETFDVQCKLIESKQ